MLHSALVMGSHWPQLVVEVTPMIIMLVVLECHILVPNNAMTILLSISTWGAKIQHQVFLKKFGFALKAVPSRHIRGWSHYRGHSGRGYQSNFRHSLQQMFDHLLWHAPRQVIGLGYSCLARKLDCSHIEYDCQGHKDAVHCSPFRVPARPCSCRHTITNGGNTLGDGFGIGGCIGCHDT